MSDDFFEKLRRVIEASAGPGTVTHISCLHDDDCPALVTHNLVDCTCHPIIERMGQA
jgi:hypothetical protein